MKAVDVSEDWPCGVQTFYRKYSSDRVIEIVRDETYNVGMKETAVNVRTFPEFKKAENGQPEIPAGEC